MFKLTMHFKNEMIGIWQRFHKTLNKVEFQINRVRIKHARPVASILNSLAMGSISGIDIQDA